MQAANIVTDDMIARMQAQLSKKCKNAPAKDDSDSGDEEPPPKKKIKAIGASGQQDGDDDEVPRPKKAVKVAVKSSGQPVVPTFDKKALAYPGIKPFAPIKYGETRIYNHAPKKTCWRAVLTKGLERSFNYSKEQPRNAWAKLVKTVLEHHGKRK